MTTESLDALLAANPTAAATDVPGLYKEALKLPRPPLVNYTTLGDLWGPVRAATVRATLITAGDALSLYVDSILAGPGFDPQNANAIATMAQFVAGSVCSQAEADLVRWVYPADLPTPDDISAARHRLAIFALSQLEGADFFNATAAAFAPVNDLHNARAAKIAAIQADAAAAVPATLADLDALP